MRNIIVRTTLPLVFLIIVLGAPARQAHASTELRVTGVIRPAACTTTLTGEGKFDYGDILWSSLRPNSPTVLPTKDITISITCAAPRQVRITTRDNRAASVVRSLHENGASVDIYAYGLGTSGSSNIGIYGIRLVPESFRGDGAVVNVLNESNGTWQTSPTSDGGYFIANGTGPKSFGASTNTPSAYSTITGTVRVNAIIDKASNLPAGRDIQLDGSSTMEFTYL